MRLDFFVKLKKWSRTIILSVGIKYSLRDLLFDVNYRQTYKVTICVTYSKWCQRSLWHQLASARLSKLWMEIYVKKILLFPHFLFFWFLIMILSYTLMKPTSCNVIRHNIHVVGGVAQGLGRRSLTGGLSLICAWSMYGWRVNTSWARRPLWVNQPGQLGLLPQWDGEWVVYR